MPPYARTPKNTLHITQSQARRFMLVHQGLYPPRRLAGKQGILELFARLGCILFDPINIVGRNPDLVLQARVAGYQPQLLAVLLQTHLCR